MAILRGLDGSFFEIPDDKLDLFRLSDKDVVDRQHAMSNREEAAEAPDGELESRQSPTSDNQGSLSLVSLGEGADIIEEFGWRNRWGLGWRNAVRTPTTTIRVKNTGGGTVWVSISQTLGRGNPGWFALPPGHTEPWSRHILRRVTIRTSRNGGANVDSTLTHDVTPEINNFSVNDGSISRG